MRGMMVEVERQECLLRGRRKLERLIGLSKLYGILG